MESAVAAARAAGPVANGATAMEEDEPPSKRVRSLYPIRLGFLRLKCSLCSLCGSRLLISHGMVL